MNNYKACLWLVAANVAMFVVQNLVGGFTDAFALHEMASNPFTLLTSMFLHGDIFHLLSNMFALAVFGLILEHNIGSKKFVMVYFAAGLLSGLAASFFYASAIGASGAIFGVLGYLAATRPRLVVWTYGVPMPMAVAALFWLVLDVAGVFYPSDVANMAHVAGLIFGVVIGLYSIRNVPKTSQEKKQRLISDSEFQHWEDQWM
jgi:membrane associated rhomboid family serine protease